MRILLFSLILILEIKVLNAVEFQGKFEQGSFILGKTIANSKVQIDGKRSGYQKMVFLLLDLIETEKMML